MAGKCEAFKPGSTAHNICKLPPKEKTKESKALDNAKRTPVAPSKGKSNFVAPQPNLKDVEKSSKSGTVTTPKPNDNLVDLGKKRLEVKGNEKGAKQGDNASKKDDSLNQEVVFV